MGIRIRIRKLDDGTFRVMYWWHWYEPMYERYFDTFEDLTEFLSKRLKTPQP